MVRVYSQTFLSPDAGSDMSLWNWSSESANLSLLKEVNEVLRLVKNCENSLACAKWMVTKLPMGMFIFPVIYHRINTYRYDKDSCLVER